MTSALATTHAASLSVFLSLFLAAADQSQTIADSIKPLIQGAITVMQVLLPLIAVFRVVYRFAEHREGAVTVLVAEIVIIMFLALILGQVLKAIVGNL